jgi:chromosomal replication initiator protein
MQAIAHYIINNDPSKKVLYVTSETFTNELIESVKTNKNSEFRNKYRNIDILLIDDIQFIIGKESTQEEFFHTFNALYQDGKQIVISSDRPPKEMETLSDRLRTRFESGLPVDIQIPTYETKMAIINKKAETLKIELPNEVKDYVATNIKSSIRELEGALTKLSAFSRLSHTPMTVEFAENTLKDLISPDSKKEITPDYIIQVVSEHTHVSTEDITSKKRTANIAYARQIVMYLCRAMTSAPLQAIGGALGGRDHTTIIHGIEKIEKEIVNNPQTKELVDILVKKINPN